MARGATPYQGTLPLVLGTLALAGVTLALFRSQAVSAGTVLEGAKGYVNPRTFTVDNETLVTVPFNLSDYDDNAILDTVTNIGRFHIHTAGRYLCEGMVSWGLRGSSGSVRSLMVVRNGQFPPIISPNVGNYPLAISNLAQGDTGTGELLQGHTSSIVSAVADLDAGDFVEFWAFVDDQNPAYRNVSAGLFGGGTDGFGLVQRIT